VKIIFIFFGILGKLPFLCSALKNDTRKQTGDCFGKSSEKFDKRKGKILLQIEF